MGLQSEAFKHNRFLKRYINGMEIRDLNIHFLIIIGKYLNVASRGTCSFVSVMRENF